jgi:hypothetical protein
MGGFLGGFGLTCFETKSSQHAFNCLTSFALGRFWEVLGVEKNWMEAEKKMRGAACPDFTFSLGGHLLFLTPQTSQGGMDAEKLVRRNNERIGGHPHYLAHVAGGVFRLYG